MESGLALFSPPEAAACDPELLAAMHPLLLEDMQSLAPWHRADLPAAAASATPAWRSAVCADTVMLVCGQCASSLDIAWRLVFAQLLSPWDCVLALSQTHGRGQLRRAWMSPPGNVYAALALPQEFRARGDMAPLLAGYCLASALGDLGVPTALKWPNDLLVQGTKVGGVLLEERGEALLAGVGLNLASAPAVDGLERDPLAPAPGTLCQFPLLAGLGPLGLWLQLLGGMRRAFESLAGCDADEAARRVETLLAWKDASVLLRESSETIPGFDRNQGRVVGIAADGALLLEHSGGTARVRSGSIVLAAT